MSGCRRGYRPAIVASRCSLQKQAMLRRRSPPFVLVNEFGHVCSSGFTLSNVIASGDSYRSTELFTNPAELR